MSQASQLNIYFVLPDEDREAAVGSDMNDAFLCVQQYKGRPQWVLPSFCLSHTPQRNDVFVFETFTGQAFEKLKKNSAKLLGAKCMLTCLSAGDSIPPGMSPIFTEGMRGLIVCCTGFDEKTKSHIRERVEYMGGNFQAALRSCITHLVAFNNISQKAVEAFKCRKKVMKLEWVDAVWKRSQETNIRGDDIVFDSYLSPLFHNLKITTSSMSKSKKETLKNMITSHGGIMTGSLESGVTNILITDKPSGEKFQAALEWKITCAKVSWITDSVEAGKILPLANYSLDKPKASTPNKGEVVNFTGHFSMLSAIEPDMGNMTHIEESANMTLSQSVMGPPRLTAASIPLSQPPSDTNAKVLEAIIESATNAGQFLDGCNVLIHGFNTATADKLRKVMNRAGATRFDELCRSVTHIIVAGSTPDPFKNVNAHIVTLDWVLESAKLKMPAPVDGFAMGEVAVQKSAPASPLSKQGARLLSRPEIPPEEIPSNFDEDDDLMMRYQLSQQGAPLEDPPPPSIPQPVPRNCSQPVNRPASQRPSSLSCSFSQTNKELFHGLKFFLSPEITEEELEEGEKTIVQYGGSVVSRKFSGVPDYAVVPMVGATLSNVTAIDVVNLLFIKDCIIENRLMTVAYYHQPFPCVKGAEPLLGCVACVTKYVSVERDFVESVIETLGGIAQDIMARRQKDDILKTTHLICTEPSGTKYEGAVRWGLPVVHHNWLLKCAEMGVRVSEEPYLLAENKSIASTTNHSKNHATQPESASSSKITDTSNAPKPSTSRNMSSNTVQRPNSSALASSSVGVDASAQPSIQKAPLAVTLEPPSSVPKLSSQAVASPVNKALERLRNAETPKNSPSPDMNRTVTPQTPLGACFGTDNPSPGTRKRLMKWVNQGANLSPYPDPQPSKSRERRDSTPVSQLLSRQIRLMMRNPEDQPPDDSPEPPAKRINLSSDSTGMLLQKMKQIEDIYGKTGSAGTSTPKEFRKSCDEETATAETAEESRVFVMTESQPNTEIGWEEPPEGRSKVRKMFMFSAVSDVDVESAKKLIERLGGTVSDSSTFEKKATHLIAGQAISRGDKLMGSIARGLWIMDASYLVELARRKSFHGVKDEDFELGSGKFSLSKYKANVREYLQMGHFWRLAVQNGQKRVFDGMKFALCISESKRNDFRRLIEAGDGSAVQLEKWPQMAAEQLYLVSDGTQPFPDSEMKTMARRKICCLNTMFISDLILRKSTAEEDNLVPGFAPFWHKYKPS